MTFFINRGYFSVVHVLIYLKVIWEHRTDLLHLTPDKPVTLVKNVEVGSWFFPDYQIVMNWKSAKQFSALMYSLFLNFYIVKLL